MKDFKIFIALASALLIIYLVAEYNKPIPINWTPSLTYNDTAPFGTYILYHQLPDFYPGARVIKRNASIYHALKDSLPASGNYLIFAKTVKFTKDDFEEMVKYIKQGNAVFISSFAIEGFIADTLKITTAYETKKGNAELNFANKNVKRYPGYSFKRDISNQYFSRFDTAKATVIGQNNFGHSTFLSFSFGKGTLYLCANPAVFTNYGLLNTQGVDYAAKVLSYLPASSVIYWDQYQNGDLPQDESPMRVFFNHASLQWAYYLSVAGILIFVLFGIKRQQRIIPEIEPLKNATVDFVNVVGQVYYEQRNNANIAHKKILYLLASLRDEYHLKTNKLDKEFIDKLTARFNADPQFIRNLVDHLNFISVQNRVSDSELLELNQLIEHFYTQTN